MKTRPCAGCGRPIPALPGKVFGIACGCAYRHTLKTAARRKRYWYNPNTERRRKGGDWARDGKVYTQGYFLRPRRRRRSTRKDIA